MRNTTQMMIVGNVVADPRIFGSRGNPDRVTFRVIANRRRRDALTGEWFDEEPYAINVVCWRSLARGVALSIRRGDPVCVSGRVARSRFTGEDGEQRWRTEIVADLIGLDLGRGYAYPFVRFTQMPASADAVRADEGDDPGEPGGIDTGEDGEDFAAGHTEAGGAEDVIDDASRAIDAFEEVPGQLAEAF